ncbi:phage terminase small subunit P27 family [Companilactobacillus alimentarius]|uniref:phage terminase small subunit P27 family n=1 Tax=Companilactobacillus alimentarius TaxID=1602 RepID=UPI0028B2725C|nr:phage terminase small subunit P27 family [Companilactobacillus alimentarius]MDT6953591.1 phage terminase small subunit P27 family [Companilactobacillus alimentarius]
MNPRNAGRKPNLAVVDPKHPEQKARQTAVKQARKGLKKLPKRAPSYLMPEAKKLWKSLVPQLESVGLVSVLDQTNLELFCTQYAMYLDAVNSISEHGQVYMDENGNLKKNPAVGIVDNCSKTLRSLGMTLGIDFNSHSQRIGVNGNDSGNIDIQKELKKFGG